MRCTRLNGWLQVTAAALLLLAGTVSSGQFLPGQQLNGILPPGQGFGGQGVQVQIPQVPLLGMPGQFSQGGSSPNGYRRGGYGSGSGLGGGSTPYGSAMAGQAAALTGQGIFELGTAQGNVLNQQATSMYFDTYKQAVNTYFDVKRTHDSAKAEHEKTPPTREQLEMAAKVGVPQRLTNNELERATGTIAWPVVLTKESFGEDRTRLERLFAERQNSGGGRGTDNYHAIRSVTSQMQSRLQSMASSLTPQEYVAGHKFITSLTHEASLTPHPGVAQQKE